MSLQKGFLRGPQVKPDSWLVFNGLLLSAAMTFVFYFFFLYFAEAFRKTLSDIHSSVLLMEKNDVRFHGYSLALLSSVIGQSFGLRLILQNLKHPKNAKTRISQRLSLQTVEVTLWYWLLWCTKLLSMLGILYTAISLQHELNIQKHIGYVFFLFSIGWFFNNWLNSYRIFRQTYFKWLFGALLYLVMSTLIFGNIRLIDHNVLNSYIRDRHPEYKYEMQVAETMSFQKNYWPREAEKLYLIHTDEGTKIVTRQTDRLPWDIYNPETSEIIQYALDSYSVYAKSRVKFIIIADERVSLREVQYLEQVLSVRGVSEIIYHTVEQYGNYSHDYSLYKRSGIPKQLKPSCNKVKQQVDSLKALGYSAKQIKWPNFGCYRLTATMNENRVLISQNGRGLTLNNTPISKQALLVALTGLVEKYKGDISFLYQPDPDLSFKQYISTRDIMIQSVILNRYRYAKDTLRMNYEFRSDRFREYNQQHKHQRADEQYPISILELTGWNLEFYKFLKK